jgi:hypothetical protein
MRLRLQAKLLIGAACIILLAISASAQGGEIVQARYGVRGRGADVTNLVRSFMRDGRLHFDVTNENLGGDPAPHQRKELLLRVRGRDGNIREYHYAERSVVDLAVDRRDGYGDGGHDHDGNYGRDDHDDHRSDHDGYGQGNYRGLQIVRASYGADRQFVDVTNLLQRHIDNGNRLSMHINNDTMGVDPAPHLHKELRVQYVYNGDRRDTVVPESGDLRIP